MKEKVLILSVRRSGYGKDEANGSITVGRLIEELQQFPSDMKIITSHSNGYTYGYIDSSDLREQNKNDD